MNAEAREEAKPVEKMEEDKKKGEKKEEKKEPWLNLLALTTVIFAVCATLATFKGGGHSTRSVMRQSQASDQWAFFQAKSLKASLAEQNRDRLELEIEGMEARAQAQLVKRYQERMEFYKGEAARYNAERKEISDKAQRFEKERDQAGRHSQAFGLAVIFLQIAILLSSIAALLKQKGIYYLGLGVGLLGLVLFVNGFFLFRGLGGFLSLFQ